MPRDGLSQYAPPPGTNGITNYTIESTKYNGFVADVTQDLNLPRPIVAGGTGANNAHDAMIALSGEIAKQVVTNYDSFAWVNGSFYSAAGATSAPNPANRFAGIYYANADDSYATVEARDQTTGIRYVRNKVAGVWGAWAQGAGSVADLDAAYVNVAGDTMTGNLTMGDTAVILSPQKGNVLGGPSGPPVNTTPPANTDANLLLYNISSGNWSGLGSDANGNFWVRVGNSGSPMSAFYVTATDQVAHFTVPPAGLNDIRYDVAQSLTAAQAVQARQNIYAAPFDAMAYNGMQVNGSCDVSQINGTASVVPGAGTGIIDSWTVYVSAAGFTSQQYPTAAPTGPVNCLSLSKATTWVAGAADYATMQNRIEGYRLARLGWGTPNAMPVTISFLAFSQNVSGQATLFVKNAAQNRCYYAPFTINAAGAWEYKSITVPGDVAGTWDATNGIGAYLSFCWAAGSSNITAAPANTWGALSGTALPGQQGFFISGSGGLVLITQLTVIPGIMGPTAAQAALITRPFDQELLTCKRYYCRPEGGVQAIVASAGANWGAVTNLPVTMRAIPTMTVQTYIVAANVTGNPTIVTPRADSFLHYATATAAGGMQYIAQFNADARL